MGSTNRSARAGSAFGFICAWVMAASLPATTLGADATQSADATEKLAEVVVTAEKRTESLQEVPMSLQALSGNELDANGFTDLEDYTRLASNVSFAPNGTGVKNGPQISIRGVSPLAGVATVAFYLDDAPISGAMRAGGMDPHVYDVDRIEVLKGPQGNLYGSSAMGGLIKIVTRQPEMNKWETGFNLTGSYTKYGTGNFSIDSVVNAPLIEDKLALRVVASVVHDGGYIDYRSPFPYGPPNTDTPPYSSPTPIKIPYVSLPSSQDVNSHETTAIRGTLKWVPTDALTITPAFVYQNSSQNALDAVYQASYGYQVPVQSPYVPESVATSFTLPTLTIQGKTAYGTFTSNTAYLDAQGNSDDDLTQVVTELYLKAMPTVVSSAYVSPIFNRTTMRDLTQEVRFASEWSFPVSAVAGLYYESRHTNDRQSMFFYQGGAQYFDVPTDLLFVKSQPAYYQDKSAYANLSWKFLDRYELQAGGRESHLTVGFDRFGDGLLNGGVSNEVTPDAITTNTALAFTGSAKITNDDMIYARVAQGYRPGSTASPAPPEAICGPVAAGNQLQPDHTLNKEVGFKTTWADGKLTLDITAFQIDYTDVQQAILLPQCGYTVDGNAGSATSRGGEGEISARLFDGTVNLHGAFGYTHATLNSAVPTVDATAGEWLINVPDWTASGSVEYRHPAVVFGGYHPYVRIDDQYVGRRFGDFGAVAGTPGIPTPSLIAHGYNLVDLHVGFESGEWDVAAFVTNLTDKRAELAYENLGPLITYINRPLTVGVSVRKLL
jgi:iron complex outermembrane recepter protein